MTPELEALCDKCGANGAAFKRRFAELLELKDGWGDKNSKAIKPDACKNLARVLALVGLFHGWPKWNICPHNDGCVEFEIIFPGVCILVVVAGCATLDCTLSDHHGEQIAVMGYSYYERLQVVPQYAVEWAASFASNCIRGFSADMVLERGA